MQRKLLSGRVQYQKEGGVSALDNQMCSNHFVDGKPGDDYGPPKLYLTKRDDGLSLQHEVLQERESLMLRLLVTMILTLKRSLKNR